MLGLRRIPLTDKQKLARVHQNVSKKIEISNIVGVKTQYFRYDRQTKRQMFWSVSSPKKLRFKKIKIKKMFVYFYKSLVLKRICNSRSHGYGSNNI